MKKVLLTLAMAVFAISAAFAQKSFNQVFPANFANGLPEGWTVKQDGITEKVPGGTKITCSQDAPKYRADLYYNEARNAEMNFTINSRDYSVYAVKFIGNRPGSGNFKLNISVNGSWIGENTTNNEAWGLNKGNNKYAGSIMDSDGNYTYYWTIEGDLWKNATEDLVIDRVEMVMADITDDAHKSYIVSEINWYKDEETLKASIETQPVVVNLTTNVKYDNFMDAYNAAVADEVLSIVAPEIIIADRTPMKSITLEGATGNEKIIQNFNNKLLFNTGSNRNMVFKNLIFEALQGPGNQPMFEHNANGKNAQTLTMTNVTLNNISSSNVNGLFNIKQGVLALNDVKFNGCTVSEAKGFVTINEKNMLRLTGDNEGLEVYLTAANSIEASELTNTTPVKITLSDEAIATLTAENTEVMAVVLGEVAADKFEITNEGYKLEADGQGNLILVVDEGSAVSEIEADENAAVEYFNLQGVKVANPEKGIFIKRQGEKTFKVIL